MSELADTAKEIAVETIGPIIARISSYVLDRLLGDQKHDSDVERLARATLKATADEAQRILEERLAGDVLAARLVELGVIAANIEALFSGSTWERAIAPIASGPNVTVLGPDDPMPSDEG